MTSSRAGLEVSRFYDPNKFEPKVGSYVEPDGWAPVGSRLEAEDYWDRAEFRLPTLSGGPVKSVACNVYRTGYKAHFSHGQYRVRVRIEFPGDGDPDTHCGGWLYA